MREFDYRSPRSLDEALALLAGAQGEARALAGGTDLISQMKEGRKSPALIVDLKGIPELNRLDFAAPDGLRLGAAVPCCAVARHPAVRQTYPMLAYACSLIGSIQIQNRASVGGNLCNAAPSADTAPPLICLETKATIAGPKGRREVPIEDFFLGPGQTVLAPDELLVEIIVPVPPAYSAGSYLRFTPREEMDIAVAGVGSFLVLEPGSRRCRRARIALGAVAPTPVRARATEAVLEAAPEVNPEVIEEAAQRAAFGDECCPITDVRGSAEYRRELVKVLTRRTLQACLKALGG